MGGHLAFSAASILDPMRLCFAMFASLACAGCRCGGSKAVPEANAMADASPDAAVEAGRPARMDHGAGIVVERIPIAFWTGGAYKRSNPDVGAD
jgi:hypothetical protein